MQTGKYPLLKAVGFCYNFYMAKMFFINHGSYPFDILCAIDTPDEDLFESLEKSLGYELSDADKASLALTGIGKTLMFDTGQSVIRIKSQKDKSIHLANISHEIFHAVEFLFSRVGLNYHIGGGEAWAYQIGHLTKQFHDELKKK